MNEQHTTSSFSAELPSSSFRVSIHSRPGPGIWNLESGIWNLESGFWSVNVQGEGGLGGEKHELSFSFPVLIPPRAEKMKEKTRAVRVTVTRAISCHICTGAAAEARNTPVHVVTRDLEKTPNETSR